VPYVDLRLESTQCFFDRKWIRPNSYLLFPPIRTNQWFYNAQSVAVETGHNQYPPDKAQKTLFNILP
jgi:hypothetical protein